MKSSLQEDNEEGWDPGRESWAHVKSHPARSKENRGQCCSFQRPVEAAHVQGLWLPLHPTDRRRCRQNIKRFPGVTRRSAVGAHHRALFNSNRQETFQPRLLGTAHGTKETQSTWRTSESWSHLATLWPKKTIKPDRNPFSERTSDMTKWGYCHLGYRDL